MDATRRTQEIIEEEVATCLSQIRYKTGPQKRSLSPPDRSDLTAAGTLLQHPIKRLRMKYILEHPPKTLASETDEFGKMVSEPSEEPKASLDSKVVEKPQENEENVYQIISLSIAELIEQLCHLREQNEGFDSFVQYFKKIQNDKPDTPTKRAIIYCACNIVYSYTIESLNLKIGDLRIDLDVNLIEKTDIICKYFLKSHAISFHSYRSNLSIIDEKGIQLSLIGGLLSALSSCLKEYDKITKDYSKTLTCPLCHTVYSVPILAFYKASICLRCFQR